MPFSFESMMQLFGQNMDREQLSNKMDDLRENLDKIVKNTSAPKAEIERLVHDKMTSFMQMIEKNDV